ncbi:MAG: hypothetical protein AB8B60_01705 [Sulfitobacter sp.]
MMTVTQEQDVTRAAEVLATLSDQIAALRREIEELIENAQSGETTTESDAKKLVQKLRDLVGHYVKAETYLNECKSKQSGIANGGYALDLDRARVDIGCKLDRLRRCGTPRAVPE